MTRYPARQRDDAGGGVAHPVHGLSQRCTRLAGQTGSLVSFPAGSLVSFRRGRCCGRRGKLAGPATTRPGGAGTEREAVAGGAARDPVPAEVLDRDPRLPSATSSKRTWTSVSWSASKLACRQLSARRCGRLPHADAADLEDLAVVVALDERARRRRGSKASVPARRRAEGEQALGRHQLPISSVKASNARSGGAATRSATRTRGTVMRHRAPRDRHVFAEGGELLGPAPLGRLEPGAQRPHRCRLQRVDAHAGVEVRVLLDHEPALAQHPQVLAHRPRA